MSVTRHQPVQTYRRLLACLICAAVVAVPVAALGQQAAAPPNGIERFFAPGSGTAISQVATGHNGMVASQEQRATDIGVDILKRGGNAVDAAVAVGFALAVTLPKAGNLGGGGFMLVHVADRNENIAIDYRETAPAAATAEMFLTPKGDADPVKSRDTGLGVGVPGTVAGLAMAHQRYGSGKFTLADLIAPAIALARDGVPVSGDLLDSLLLAQPQLIRWPASAKIFLKADGTVPNDATRLVQADLAASLRAIAHEGSRAFYIGPIADKIVTAVRAAGGVMTRRDLEDYEPVVRNPLYGTYRGYEIVAMPPPSSGGVHLIEMLNILEGFPSSIIGEGSSSGLHLMVEAMKLAYADRAAFMGDSDRIKVPVDRLISKDHAAALRARINPLHATASVAARPLDPERGGNTTHFSVVDRFGNAVANTYTLNFNYGLGLVADGTGILLNNELDDFAAKPGAPNAFGLVGGAANAPGPGKRPLSSMSPTMVFRDNRPVLVTGAPGGSRIITSVLQVITHTIDGGMAIGDAVAAPRLHHQWLPDEIVVEPGFPPDRLQALAGFGHHVRPGPFFGSAHSIAVMPQSNSPAAAPQIGSTPATPQIGSTPAAPQIGSTPATPQIGSTPTTPQIRSAPAAPQILIGAADGRARGAAAAGY